jgi:Family of unknown function (DUF6000)
MTGDRDEIFETVDPYYLDLLHVNILSRDTAEVDAFVARFTAAAVRVSDELLASLLAIEEWRSRMVGGWMLAVNERRQHLPAVRSALAAATLVYPQGLCVALAALPDEAGAKALTEYLTRWLTPDADHHHDQPWVLAALEEVDRATGCDHASQFTRAGGPWEAWAGGSAASYREAGRGWMTRASDLVARCRGRLGATARRPA